MSPHAVIVRRERFSVAPILIRVSCRRPLLNVSTRKQYSGPVGGLPALQQGSLVPIGHKRHGFAQRPAIEAPNGYESSFQDAFAPQQHI